MTVDPNITEMIHQEPVQAAIWDALNHYAYPDAAFLAERLFAEAPNHDTLYLLATCYFRAGRPIQAHLLLQKHDSPSHDCKYLLAKCCIEIDKLCEAESVLVGDVFTKYNSSLDEVEVEYGNMACHVFSLLASVYSKTDRIEKAVECYKRSLRLNPLLWKSFERLCQLGEKVDPCQIFQNTLPVADTPLPSFSIGVADTISPISTTHSPGLKLLNVQSPMPSINVIPADSINLTPDNQNVPIISQIPTAPKVTRIKKNNREPPTGLSKAMSRKTLFNIQSPLSPSFGVMPFDSSSPRIHNMPFLTPSPVALSETQLKDVEAPYKKPVTRRQNQNLVPKPPVFNFCGNSKSQDIGNQQSGLPNVRRSSRLFGNSSSVKENNKSQGNKTRLTSPKAINRKSKSRTIKSQQELNEINKEDYTADNKSYINDAPSQTQMIIHMQHQSMAGVLTLLQALGKGYQALSDYNSKKAIDLFSKLPEHQYNTGWVLSQIAKSFYYMANYHKAKRLFQEVRRLEPYYLESMDLYSTTLWHLQLEVELSTLAKDLTELDKTSPQAWCATGNCFSLQQEHDLAIKFFQRALQVDPNCSYAYTLLGHEYVTTEEFDKAMACFRNAVRVDIRLYTAWYGIGLIYHKQEKYNLAELHFRKALSINPESSVLMCHVAVVQHAQKKSEPALKTLEKAISIDPKNALCKFHRASILFAVDKDQEALKELEELKQLVPKESLVYFLIGKVHRKLGNTHLSLINFSWATDLDPQGANNSIKEAIDKRYSTDADDDDVIFGGNEGSFDPVGNLDELGEGPSQSDDNGPVFDQDLQAVESDESL
ncbi:hypothetical protein SNE40_023090 [Patella caerulea]|uniref:Cell division cycle protein 27 homolog n=2 Tax=Patella caerulea TaxID=87958 RepID=A0AAN8GHE1_PATCE